MTGFDLYPRIAMKKTTLALLPLILLVGCQSESEEGGGAAGAATAVESPSTPSQDTAEAAIQSVIDGVKNGQAVVAWNALPAKHQKDINDVVHKFAENMDPNVWGQVTGVLKTIHSILDEKSEFVAGYPQLASLPNAKEVVPQVAGLLKTILDGAGDLEGLKSFDGESFAKGPGANLLTQMNALSTLNPDPAGGLFASMDKLKFETIEATDTSATLKMTDPTGKETEQNFVKLEGKWVPLDLVQTWDAKLKEANEGLDKMPETMKKASGQVMMMSGAVNGMLAPLKNAADQEQFNNAMNGLMSNAMMMMGGMGGGMGGPPPSAQPPQSSESPGSSDTEPAGDSAPAAEPPAEK